MCRIPQLTVQGIRIAQGSAVKIPGLRKKEIRVAGTVPLSALVSSDDWLLAPDFNSGKPKRDHSHTANQIHGFRTQRGHCL
jgi:hypothetical protein